MIWDRRNDRELCADLVQVRWKTEMEEVRTDTAILEDISPAGACLEMERMIPPGTKILLDFPTDHCNARVIYCKFDEIKYLIGVEFEQGYRWSRRKFKPQHLLQFRLRNVIKTR